MSNLPGMRTIIISLAMVGVFGYQAWVHRPVSSNPQARPGRFTTSLALVVGAVALGIGKARGVPPPLWLMGLVLAAFIAGTVWDLRHSIRAEKRERAGRKA